MMFYDFAERIRALERQEEKDIIPLNAGNTNISVPGCAIQAMSEYLRKNKKAQYLPAAGLPELREKIAERENCPVENILVGPGSKYLIYGLFSTLGLKNKKILVPQPHWPAYGLIAKKLGLTVEAIETSLDNRWDFGELNFDESNILMLCNPLNPTSTTYGHDLIERTIESAKQKSVSVIIDEAYKGLAYNKIKDYDAIRVRSFSKEFNMENFRLAYIVAPENLVEKMTEFNQINITCLPEFTQIAGIACLENEGKILEENKRIWKTRVSFSDNQLRKMGFNFVSPDAGIYLFATHENIKESKSFAYSLLDEGVAVAPNLGFGNYDTFIRICPNQDIAVLKEAFELMEKVLSK